MRCLWLASNRGFHAAGQVPRLVKAVSRPAFLGPNLSRVTWIRGSYWSDIQGRYRPVDRTFLFALGHGLRQNVGPTSDAKLPAD